MNTDNRQTNILLAGVGGQGVILVSTIIARAAMHAGYDVKTNEVHGMAQRGGSVLAQVRFGSRIFSPLVWEGTADLIISLERIEAIRFSHFLAPGGLAVCSAQAIIPVTVSSGKAHYPESASEDLKRIFPRLIYADAQQSAHDLGNVKAANVVLLGAAAGEIDLPDDAWEKSIKESVADKHLALNMKAFEAGRRLS
ncbi:MAG: indolepyruvate oxidoreductase subunit beta [Spirochaetota bacterium]